MALITGSLIAYLIDYNLSLLNFNLNPWYYLLVTTPVMLILIFLSPTEFEKPELKISNPFFLILIVLGIAFFYLIGLSKPITTWDAIGCWMFKAKILFNETLATTTMFSKINKAYMQFEYPLLLPFLYKSLYGFYGKVNEIGAHASFAFYFTAASVIFYKTLKDVTSRRYAMFFTVILVYFPMPFLHENVREGADGYVAIYFLISALMIFTYFFNKQNIITLFNLFSSLSVLALLKNEGKPQAGILILVFLFLVFLQKNKLQILKKSILPFSFFIAVFLNWYFLYRTLPNYTAKYPELLTFPNIVKNLGKLPTIITSIIESWSLLSSYSLFWIVFIYILLLHFKKLLTLKRLALLSAFFAPVFIYIIIYAIQTMFPLTELITHTISRITYHLVPYGIFIISVFAYEIISDKEIIS